MFSVTIILEGAVNTLPAQKLVVSLDSLNTIGRKRLGMQHAHLKLPCFLSEENRRLFNLFCHVLPRFLSRKQHIPDENRNSLSYRWLAIKRWGPLCTQITNQSRGWSCRCKPRRGCRYLSSTCRRWASGLGDCSQIAIGRTVHKS